MPTRVHGSTIAPRRRVAAPIRGGDYAVETPYADQLAAEGAVFPNAYVPGNTCAPGRAALFYGKYNRHLRFYTKKSFKEGNSDCIAPTYNGVPAHDAQHWTVACLLKDTNRLYYPASSPATTTTTIPGVPRDLPGDLGMETKHRYFAFLKGKEEAGVKATGGGFDGGSGGANPVIGNIEDTCDAASDCATKLKAWQFPVDTNGVGTIRDVESSLDTIAASVTDAVKYEIKRPFLFWYSPNIPHEGGAMPPVLAPRYNFPNGTTGTFFPAGDVMNNEWASHLVRTTLFDTGLGAVLHGLQRRCVCDPTVANGAVSLYDRTVVVLVTDNGYALPVSKGYPHHNSNRMAMVINEPAHRGPNAVAKPRVFRNDLASAVDVAPTIVSYASHPYDPLHASSGDCGLFQPRATGQPLYDQTGYPFGKSLCSAVRTVNADPFAIAGIHNSLFGDDTTNSWGDTGNTAERYMTTAPGVLGVCLVGGTPVLTPPSGGNQHVKVCRIAGDCATSNATCEKTIGGVCNPIATCLTNADCSPNVACSGGFCSFACSAVGAACGAGGTCNASLQCVVSSTIPCQHSRECPFPGMACLSVGNKGGRCLNDPKVACGIDKECGKNLCTGVGPSNTCKGSVQNGDAGPPGRFGDFVRNTWSNSVAPNSKWKPPIGDPVHGWDLERKAQSCSAAANDESDECVPRGTCQRVQLKVYRSGDDALDGIKKVFDIARSPDELDSENLLLMDAGYLATTGTAPLRTVSQQCLKAFWNEGPITSPIQSDTAPWTVWLASSLIGDCATLW